MSDCPAKNACYIEQVAVDEAAKRCAIGSGGNYATFLIEHGLCGLPFLYLKRDKGVVFFLKKPKKTPIVILACGANKSIQILFLDDALTLHRLEILGFLFLGILLNFLPSTLLSEQTCFGLKMHYAE